MPGDRYQTKPGNHNQRKELIMKFDPQTVAQAEAFVNAIRAGKRARMPALRFGQWQQFMTTVYAGLGLA